VQPSPPDPELIPPGPVPYEPPQVVVVRPPRRPLWFHALLFLLTCLTTLIVGARLQERFDNVQPMFLADPNFFPWQHFVRYPKDLLHGLPFAGSLLAILFAHEMGHFLLAVRNRVYATLPFFLPAPTPIGTFGAFIQIRSRFHSRSELLDIAIGGPIAGFVVALPLAIVGLMLSRPVYVPEGSVMGLGMPVIFEILLRPLHAAGWHHDVPLRLLLLHPIALAAWVGMLATALNLLPGGQLDGGHIVYALSPRAHRWMSLVGAVGLLVAAYFLWAGWLIWAIAFLITRKHPPVMRPEPAIPKSRRLLAWVGLLLLVLTIMPVPFDSGSFKDEVQQIWPSHQR
jgi:membrane-associated protease RseP (regulator of RpoE activity)